MHVSFAGKCHVVYYCYNLSNQVVRQESTFKHLGVILSENGSWSDHVDSALRKACATLGFLQKNLKHVGKHVKEAAHKA